tara:strand:+ start:8235 stop:9113 length:879 start_codon:yes stop_codon:yes gene_type:complete
MARYATGKKSLAISDRSGFRLKYKNLKTEWNNLRVEPEEYDPKQPQLTPAKNVIDAVALFQPRPDNDPTNVWINLQYGWFDFNKAKTDADGFTQRSLDSTQYQKPQMPHAKGNVGNVSIEFPTIINQTGVSATGFTSPYAPLIKLSPTQSGVAATGNIGTIAGFTTEQALTGVAGTGVIGTYAETDGVNLSITEAGVAGTGAIGTASANPDHNRWGIGPWGTGAWGISNPAPEVDVTGVAATGALGTISSITTGASVTETGVAGTGALGSISVTTTYTSWGDESWGDSTWGQ